MLPHHDHVHVSLLLSCAAVQSIAAAVQSTAAAAAAATAAAAAARLAARRTTLPSPPNSARGRELGTRPLGTLVVGRGPLLRLGPAEHFPDVLPHERARAHVDRRAQPPPLRARLEELRRQATRCSRCWHRRCRQRRRRCHGGRGIERVLVLAIAAIRVVVASPHHRGERAAGAAQAAGPVAAGTGAERRAGCGETLSRATRRGQMGAGAW